jgi:hypothetical protein
MIAGHHKVLTYSGGCPSAKGHDEEVDSHGGGCVQAPQMSMKQMIGEGMEKNDGYWSN